MFFNTESKPAAQCNIVIIDDDPFVLRVHAEMIRLMGHSVSAFECPKQALNYLQAHAGDVNLVITDYDMPGINGLDLIARLREAGCDFPSIILTGYISEVDAERAASFDVKVISKPIPMRVLAGHIQSFQGVY